MAQNNEEEILLNIVVSNDSAAQAIFESQQAIDKLKQSQVELAAEFKKGSLTQEEYSKKTTAVKAAIGQQNEAIRANEKEIKNNIKTQAANSDSLVSLRAQLSNSTKAYDALSKSERESAKGQELAKSINETVEKLNEAEQATGRFQRKIGDYKGLTDEAGQGVNRVTGFLGKMSSQVSAISPQMGSMISQFGGFAAKSALVASETNLMNGVINKSGAALNAVEGFAGKAGGSLNNVASGAVVAGKATEGAFSSITKGAVTMGKAFLSPPIIIITAVILAIIGACKLLADGFKKNDEASEKMSEAFAIFTPILDYVGKLFTAVAGAVADLVLGFSKGLATIVDFTAGLFGVKTGLSEAAQEARNLVKAQDALEEAERDYTVNSAKRNVERAKLLAEVVDKNKNDAKTRIAYLKDALALDKANLVDEKKIAYEKLRLIVEVAKNENDTSDETAKKIADARAEAYNATAKYFEGVKDINKKLNSAEDELANEQKARFEEWKKNNDEQLAKEKTYLRQLEDLVTGQIKSDLERQIQAEKQSTDRANSDLKEKLKTEKNLTSEARAEINEIIILNKQNLDSKISELNKKASDEEIKKDIDKQQQIYLAKIELATKGSDEEYNLLVAKLELQKSVELSNLELTNVEQAAIIDKYDEQETELKNKHLSDRYKNLQDFSNKELELKLLKIQDEAFAEEAANQAILERETKINEDLKLLDSETKDALYNSQIEYEIAVAESDARVKKANQQVLDSQLTNAQNYLNAVGSMADSMSQLATALSDDSKEAADFAKAMALIQIGISLAVGIAGAVKQAAAATTWYEGAAALAVGLASVASAIVSAKKL